MALKDFKESYAKAQKKFSLPSFEEMNTIFDLEKLDRETDRPLRAIRRIMNDKIINSLSLLEMLLNPSNAPRMYYPFLKSVNTEDKDTLEKLYTTFADMNLRALQLEVQYDEIEEVELVKEIFSSWQTLAPKFVQLLEKIRKPVQSEQKKERSYFG